MNGSLKVMAFSLTAKNAKHPLTSGFISSTPEDYLRINVRSQLLLLSRRFDYQIHQINLFAKKRRFNSSEFFSMNTPPTPRYPRKQMKISS